MEKKSESDAYWLSSSHQGFFSEDQNPTKSKLPSIALNNDQNQFDLITCRGLTEAAENSSEKLFESNKSPLKNDVLASKVIKPVNLFEKPQKIASTGAIGEPKQTIKNIILGFDYSLEQHKRKKEKSALLYEAVMSHDGNAILEVVLFLRDTLKKAIFQRELMSYLEAVNVYLSYLEEEHEMVELSNMLLLLDKGEDAAILKYEAAVSNEYPERKFELIGNCLSTHFQYDAISPFYYQSVEEHKKLLSEQLKFECNLRPENFHLFEKACKKQSFVDSSVLSTLIFCFTCFHKTDQVKFAEEIKSNFKLSKKQFTWSALRALAVSENWKDLENLFSSKNWLGGKKFQSCIDFPRILEVIYKEKAPKDVLEKYLTCVESEEEKILLASKYGCHRIALEIFQKNKDRQGLIKYQSYLVPHSVDYLNCLEILNNPLTRWKT